jgi:hypothetical protein
MIMQSFIVAGEAHYDFWTLVSNGNSNSSLLYGLCFLTFQK